VNNELKHAEEERRERNWDPVQRWKALQETIAWAQSQGTVRRNIKAARLAEQEEKLARLRASSTQSV
jgi:hypothetical protein